MIGEGTAEVALTIVSPNNAFKASIDEAPTRFWVQVGAFKILMEAMTLRERLASHYDHVRVQTVNLSSGEWHRVQVGTFPSKKKAQTVARTLQNDLGGEPLILTSN